MAKSIVQQVFERLNTKQRNNLKKFIESPYFNRDRTGQVSELFDWLFEKVKTKQPIILDEAHQKILGKGFSVTDGRQLNYRLLKLIKEFLIINEIEADKSTATFSLLKSYRKLSLRELFESTLRSFSKGTKYRNISYLRNNLDLETQSFEYLDADRRLEPEHLIKIDASLDRFYIAAKLKQACFLISHKLQAQGSDQISPMLAAALKLLENQEEKDLFLLEEEPAIAIYFYSYKVLKEGKKEDVDKLSSLAEQHRSSFPKDEMRDIYLFIINHYIGQMNKGNKESATHCLQIFSDCLEAEVLLENNEMSKFIYHNFAHAAAELGKYTLVEGFLREYRRHLPVGQKDSIFNLSWGTLKYLQGQEYYKEAIRHLSKYLSESTADHDDKDELLKLKARTFLLKMNHELNNSDNQDIVDKMSDDLGRLEPVLNRVKYDFYRTINSFFKQLESLTGDNIKGKIDFQSDLDSSSLRESWKKWFKKELDKV